MAQPPNYDRQYDFSDFQTQYPDQPLPGNQLDIELDTVRASVNALVTNIGIVQKDDGSLRNASVDVEQLTQSVITLLQENSWSFTGDWVTAISYAVNDVVKYAPDGATYVCTTAHTSGTFTDDRDTSNYWYLFANPIGALGQIQFDRFSGNASTTAFTLSVSLTDEKQVMVFVDGNVVDPLADYTVSGTTLTFTTPPPTGTNNILVFGVDNTAATAAAEASASATSAATSASNAATSETNAATSETNAATSASNASTSETNAATSASNAATSETNAANSAASAAALAQGFSGVTLLTASSNDVEIADARAYYQVDASSNTVDINLPSIGTGNDGLSYTLEVLDVSNAITLVRDGTDTINGVAGDYTGLVEPGQVIQIIADDGTPDNWIVVQSSALQVDDSTVELSGRTIRIKDDGVDPTKAKAGRNTQTGTTYTLALTDNLKTVSMDNASANTLTIPLNSSVAFTADETRIDIIQLGAGQTTIDAAAGVTLNGVSGGSTTISAQYGFATVLKLATDTWVVGGSIAEVA